MRSRTVRSFTVVFASRTGICVGITGLSAFLAGLFIIFVGMIGGIPFVSPQDSPFTFLIWGICLVLAFLSRWFILFLLACVFRYTFFGNSLADIAVTLFTIILGLPIMPVCVSPCSHVPVFAVTLGDRLISSNVEVIPRGRFIAVAFSVLRVPCASPVAFFVGRTSKGSS